MSFASKLKQEIISDTYKSTCCKKAFLCGILASKGKTVNGEISFNLENDEYCRYVADLIFDFYGAEAKILKLGGRCRTLAFSSKGAMRYLDSLDKGEELFTPKCPSCTAAFFRGMFLASGRVTDPQNQYLLEFSPVNYPDKAVEVFAENSIELKKTVRRGIAVIYVKRSVMIEDFLAFIGMNSAAFDFMNAKIEGELKNNANRAANCDSNNINRAVNASHKQFAVLDELKKNNLLSSLPEELEKTAKLKLANRDMSLSQLAAISVPPISKSGLSHRLNRILEIAEQLMTGIKK